MRLITFAFPSLTIDDKIAIGYLIQRSGLSLLQSKVRWIAELKKPKKCDVFIDFNGDLQYLNFSGLGSPCSNSAEYQIVYESINKKIYSKNICKECIKNAMRATLAKYLREI